jgi:DNA segregation ATPase FtsK/SpoIIIE-like protein
MAVSDDNGNIEQTRQDAWLRHLDAARVSVRAAANGSTSRLARELRIGWKVADRLLEALAAEGVVSPSDRDGMRQVQEAQLNGR